MTPTTEASEVPYKLPEYSALSMKSPAATPVSKSILSTK